MYNISDYLLVPAKNKMYKGADQVHFIYAGPVKSQKYVIWLNVGGPILFITVAKSKMYCMGVKSQKEEKN